MSSQETDHWAPSEHQREMIEQAQQAAYNKWVESGAKGFGPMRTDFDYERPTPKQQRGAQGFRMIAPFIIRK